MREALNFIPNNENIFFHCRLKSFNSSNDYKKTSLLLINLLKEKNLKSLIIPAYTYSFTNSSKFNRNLSSSEVGRFSEEVRLICKSYQRSLDPIFSFLDVFNNGFVDNEIITSSFDKNSIFNKWNEINGIIVNFGLDEIFSTQFHFIEREMNVEYREFKKFTGSVISDGIEKKIEYNFFCRKDTSRDFFNRKKIEEDMKTENILNQKSIENVKVVWFRSKQLYEFLSKKIKKDPNYLIS